MNFVEELKWRGMIHDIMPGTEEQFAKEMTSAYIGFDPTADSLHIGSLVQIMILVHLQKRDINQLLWLEVLLEWWVILLENQKSVIFWMKKL